MMAYAGMGRGDYILKTQYEYVGRGAGEFIPQMDRRPYQQCAWCLGVGCLALLLIVPLFWWWSSQGLAPVHNPPAQSSLFNPTLPPTPGSPAPAPPTTPTVVTTPKPLCVIWGDPHVKVFDSGKLNSALPVTFLLNGDYWLVRSNDIWIQGRYEAATWDNGLASLHGIAVGGPFLGSHNDKIIVGPRSGKVYYNNQEILGSLPGQFTSPRGAAHFRAIYQENVVQLDNNVQQRVPGIDLHLPRGVVIRVNRWPRHIDAIIRMTKVAGQDGACGNFNGNYHDDTKELIERRVPQHVPSAKNLFPPAVFNTAAPAPYTVQDCDQQLLKKATSHCQAANKNAGQALVSACVLDVCRNGMQMVNEGAATVKMAGR
jgi:hypothetical protein